MGIINLLIKSVFLLLIVASIALISLIAFALQDRPLYVEKTHISETEIEQVRAFIQKNNPLYFTQGQKKEITISEKQIALISKYLQNKFPDLLQSRTRLFSDAAYIVMSIHLPANPLSLFFGNYLNITMEVWQQDDGLKIKSLEVGDIKVDDSISNLLLQKTHQRLEQSYPEYRDMLQSISHFSVSRKRLDIVFTWNKNIAGQIRNKMAGSILSADIASRINIYTQHLNRLMTGPQGIRPSLTHLIQPMFLYALERSQNNDPVLENRALLIVLGGYVVNRNIAKLMGDPNAADLKYIDFYLNNRNDLSKHFLVSAALSALSNPAIAHTIGLEKELKDSNGGSGFSFADLAADRAGVTLANTGLASENYARMVQQRLARSTTERDFMPDIQHLPEGLQSINFRQIYKDTSSENYKKVINLIDQRIARCGIYDRH